VSLGSARQRIIYNILVRDLSEKDLLEERKRNERIKMVFREVSCEKGKRMELAQDIVQWRILV
jgi:hypothetical protein